MPGPLKTCLRWASRGSDSPLYWSGNEGPGSLGNFPKISWSHGKRGGDSPGWRSQLPRATHPSPKSGGHCRWPGRRLCTRVPPGLCMHACADWLGGQPPAAPWSCTMDSGPAGSTGPERGHPKSQQAHAGGLVQSPREGWIPARVGFLHAKAFYLRVPTSIPTQPCLSDVQTDPWNQAREFPGSLQTFLIQLLHRCGSKDTLNLSFMQYVLCTLQSQFSFGGYRIQCRKVQATKAPQCSGWSPATDCPVQRGSTFPYSETPGQTRGLLVTGNARIYRVQFRYYVAHRSQGWPLGAISAVSVVVSITYLTLFFESMIPYLTSGGSFVHFCSLCIPSTT